MEQFKTMNNAVCKSVLYLACYNKTRMAYMRFFNQHEMLNNSVADRLYKLLCELAPLTIDIFKTLPLSVQNFYNAIYLKGGVKQ